MSKDPIPAAAGIKKEPPEPNHVFQTVAQPQPQQQEQQPQFLKFIADLSSLSAGICAFKRSFDDLYKNLDFLQNSIDSIVNNLHHQRHLHQTPTLQPVIPATAAVVRCELNPPAEAPPETRTADPAEAGPEPQYLTTAKPLRTSEIEHLCRKMSSRGVRKYIADRLPLSGDVAQLRQEVVAALKLAPKPAKLVSDCIGKFYLQGAWSFSKDPNAALLRRARVLLLESFLLMLASCCRNGVEIEFEQTLKEAAEQGAVSWQKRMIYEGGLDKATEIDARGLLLFTSAFGIPPSFTDEDLVDLSLVCNMEEILDSLKASRQLLAKLPGIIDCMAKNGRYAEAIVFACSFGVEDKFPPRAILTTFLQESKQRCTSERMEDTNNSPVSLDKSKEKQLAALNSVVKFVEEHGWDLEKLCAGWQVKEMISNLEKEIANNLDKTKHLGDRRAMAKRKWDEVGCSNKVSEEINCSHLRVVDPLLLTSPGVNGGSPEVNGGGLDKQQHGVVTLSNGPPMCSSYKATFHDHNFSDSMSVSLAPNVGVAPIVGTYAAVVHEVETCARPRLRPHNEINGNVVPSLMDGQGHGSVGQKSSSKHPASVVASGNEHYYASQSSGISHHMLTIPNLYSFVDQVEDEREESKDRASGPAAPCVFSYPPTSSSYVH